MSAYRSQKPSSEVTLNKQLKNKQAYTIDGENDNHLFLPKLLSAMWTQISWFELTSKQLVHMQCNMYTYML